MTGKFTIIVRNNKVQFTIELMRKITVISGDSATGKTTLVSLLRSFQNYGAQSGIKVSSTRPCMVIDSSNWQSLVEQTQDAILFIDEGNRFLRSKEFADAVKHSSCYFVLVTRESLSQLPYSVHSLLKLKKTASRSKITYNRSYPVYDHIQSFIAHLENAYILITEDSGSGFQLFSHIAQLKGTDCLTASGKSNIPDAMLNNRDKKLIIIADGAAFGSEIKKIYEIMEEMRQSNDVILYLPESFEWIILKSGIVHTNALDDILESPWNFIDSNDYTSWEQFFFDYLQNITKDSVFHYSKTNLPKPYFDELNIQKIISVITGEMQLPDYSRQD